MTKANKVLFALLFMLFTFCGCTPIGDKNMSISVVYFATTVIAFVLLICYCLIIKKREPWFITLYSSVFIVNIGYYLLSISNSLDMALHSNRIAYLGAVMLPLSMLMIIKKMCSITYHKTFTITLVAISVVIFIIAASPGYSDIYYKSVQLITANGVSLLEKEYGSLHILYLFYLISYFIAMVSTIVYAIAVKKLKNFLQSVFLAIAVLLNICVWLIEQLVHINFEFLSVSYIVTEVFMLVLYMIIQETERVINKIKSDNETQVKALQMQNLKKKKSVNTKSDSFVSQEQCEYFKNNLNTLTPTETIIANLHLQSKSTKEILEQLSIKENTLKYHNKNIFGKLGVNSRKQLREIAVILSIEQL